MPPRRRVAGRQVVNSPIHQISGSGSSIHWSTGPGINREETPVFFPEENLGDTLARFDNTRFEPVSRDNIFSSARIGSMGDDLEALAFEIAEAESTKKSVDPELRNEEPGKIIKSKRTFGLEFEVNFNTKNIKNLVKEIGPKFLIEHDGSVRDGIEVVSPVLQGAAGEKQTLKVCSALKKNGADTDDSCGLHVHLGAKDFFNIKDGKVTSLQKAMDFLGKKESRESDFFIIHESIIKYLQNSNSSVKQRVAMDIINGHEIDIFRAQEIRNILFNGEKIVRFAAVIDGESKPGVYFFMCVERNSRNKTTFPIKEIKNNGKELQAHKGEPKVLWQSQAVFIDKIASRKMKVVRISRNEDLQFSSRIKRAVAFYVAFDDVIASMLPLERRDNDYAGRVNQKICIEQLESCDSVLDIFKEWMHLGENADLERIRHENRHRSRYCGLNLHALLKHGTIEIRYHSGTIESHKALHWTALHQAILDMASDLDNPKCRLQNLQKASMIIDLNQKTRLFFKKLNLQLDTENYFLNRIQEFKSDDAAILEDCILTDANPIN